MGQERYRPPDEPQRWSCENSSRCFGGGNKEKEVNPSTSMYYDGRVHGCEWYHHTAIVLYHMLSSLPCTRALSAEICTKVVECAEVVCKMQVSILQAAFNSLCCILLHGIGMLKHIGTHLTRAEESIAFCTQTKNCCIGTEFNSSLKNPSALRFVAL